MYYCDKHKISQSIPESHTCMHRKHEMSPTLRMVSEIDPSCRCTHLIFVQIVRKCQVQKIHVFGNINVSSPLQTLLSHTNTLTFITEGLIHCDAETNCEPQTASSLSFWPLGLVFRHKVWPCTTWLNVLFTMKSTSCARRSRQGKIGEDAICQRVARGRGRLQILLKKRHLLGVQNSHSRLWVFCFFFFSLPIPPDSPSSSYCCKGRRNPGETKTEGAVARMATNGYWCPGFHVNIFGMWIAQFT